MIPKILGVSLALLALAGCGQTYVTPPAGAELTALSDANLRGYYETRPVTPFPANVAVVRIAQNQAVTVREVESDEHFEQIESLPLIQDVAPIGKLLLPSRVRSFDDLRPSAARLHADLLLVYTIDTSFTVEGRTFGPAELVSLGMIRHKKAHVTATVSGMLVDVRTGFIYGTAESTAEEHKKANIWTKRSAVDSSRQLAEARAFDDFVDEFTRLWKGVVDVHAARQPNIPSTPVAIVDEDGDTYYRVKFSSR